MRLAMAAVSLTICRVPLSSAVLELPSSWRFCLAILRPRVWGATSLTLKNRRALPCRSASSSRASSPLPFWTAARWRLRLRRAFSLNIGLCSPNERLESGPFCCLVLSRKSSRLAAPPCVLRIPLWPSPTCRGFRLLPLGRLRGSCPTKGGNTLRRCIR